MANLNAQAEEKSRSHATTLVFVAVSILNSLHFETLTTSLILFQALAAKFEREFAISKQSDTTGAASNVVVAKKSKVWNTEKKTEVHTSNKKSRYTRNLECQEAKSLPSMHEMGPR